jgi:hypothetical protein
VVRLLVDTIQLVSEEVYERHLHLSTREAEGQASQSYHCKTPDCAGWCTFEDGVSTFFCYTCRRLNCLLCEAVHEGEECGDYQRRLRAEARRNPAAMAKLTIEVILCVPVCRMFRRCVLVKLLGNLVVLLA